MRSYLRNNAGRIAEISLVVVLSLTPLLWFHGNLLITGGDIDYPIDPIGRFIARTYIWNDWFLAGTDRSLDASTLFYTGVEALGYFLTHNLVSSEKFAFVFWFGASGFSMWYLMSALFPRYRFARIAATVYYMFDWYQFYNWEIARIGELSATVFAPLIMGALVRAFERRITPSAFAAYIFVFSIICMGIGVQPPIVLAISLMLGPFAAMEFVANGGLRDYRKALYLTFLLSIAVSVFIAANAIWLLPEINFIVGSGYTQTSHGIKVFAVDYLLTWVSGNTSLRNNFGLAGRIANYDSWKGEPYIPHVSQLFHNPFFHNLGLLQAIAAFSTLLFTRRRRALFFAAFALLSIYLSKGSHTPWPLAYSEFIRHVPFFWIIRAPWEKYALLTALSYSVLIGLAMEYAAVTLQRRALHAARTPGLRTLASRAALLSVGLFVVIDVGYHYPLVAGFNFPVQHDPLMGFHQNIPHYVEETTDYLNRKPGEFNVVPLPDERANVYTWGYAAPSDITVAFLKRGIINRQYGEGTAPPGPIDAAYDALVQVIYEGDPTTTAMVSRLLNVGYVIERRDIVYNYFDGTDSPAFIAAKLAKLPNFVREPHPGAWSLYRNLDPGEHFYASNTVRAVLGSFASAVTNTPPLSSRETLLVSSGLASNPNVTSAIDRYSKSGSALDVHTFVPLDVAAGLSAASFSGVHGVVSADPKDGNTMLVATKNTPYRFQGGQPTWSALNSTLVYITSGALPVRLGPFRSDAGDLSDLIGVVWGSDWQGFGTKPIQFPITIPPHEHAVAQINHIVRGPIYTLVGDREHTLAVQDGDHGPLRAAFAGNRPLENSASAAVPSNGLYSLLLRTGGRQADAAARVRINGRSLGATVPVQGGRKDVIAFPALPLHTGTADIEIDCGRCSLEGGSLERVGATDAMPQAMDVSAQRVNPAWIDLDVSSESPGLLVFQENYNSGWLLLPGVPSFREALQAGFHKTDHLIANGYANAWEIGKGDEHYTLVFWPFLLSIVGRVAGMIVLFVIIVACVSRRPWKIRHRVLSKGV